MAKVEIFGHSDDCINVEGDFGDEFNLWDEVKYLHFSDGTVISGEHGPSDDRDYCWRFRVVKKGTATATMGLGRYHNEEPDMKDDKITLVGDISWVRCFGDANGPTQDDIEEFIDNLSPTDMTAEQWLRVMAIAGA